MAECFYCDCELVVVRFEMGKTTPPNLKTKDHIYPRSATPFRSNNKVPACAACNNRKGSKHPLTWLTSVHLSDAGAERLRDKLIDMGEKPERVDHAYRERWKNIENRARLRASS